MQRQMIEIHIKYCKVANSNTSCVEEHAAFFQIVHFNLNILGWFKNPLSSQTEKLMAGTKFSDYLGLNHYKKAKKLKHFIHLRLAQGPQSFATYRSISPTGNLGNQLKNHVLVM